MSPTPERPQRRDDSAEDAPTPRASWGNPWQGERLAAIAAGAAAGALARYAIGLATATPKGELPVATLLVNLGGCLAIGLLTPLLARRSPLLNIALTTGFLGGFTTFATFTLDLEQLTRPAPDTMIVYLLLTVVGCIVAAAVGLVAGERIVNPPRPEDDDRNPQLQHEHRSPVVDRHRHRDRGVS